MKQTADAKKKIPLSGSDITFNVVNYAVFGILTIL